MAGEPTVEKIESRLSRALGVQWRWLRPLAERYIKSLSGQTRPRHREVAKFLLGDRGFSRAWLKYSPELWIAEWLTEPERMQPVESAAGWDIPAIVSAGALADWFSVSTEELEWFADLKGLGYRSVDRPKFAHYHYKVFIKRAGSIRLIESPKARLKELQRQILKMILDKIPPHRAVHGFCKGRSIKTFAAPHVGHRVVLRMDLQDFFPSISGARIQALFRTIGYPETVANLLGGICTNATPRNVWSEIVNDVGIRQIQEIRDLYRRPHLPQGAPTSPSLANLCFYRADCRLAKLAALVGATYTRYADDLAFSGDGEFERRVERFSPYIAAILHEEGFATNHHKTKVMRQGVRQHLAGLTVNQSLNIKRFEFDRLKAILTNCIRHSPENQNRGDHPDFRRHLEGRIGFVETVNATKGKRLRKLFNRIEWR